MYHWSLAWRILSITLLACEMSAIVFCNVKVTINGCILMIFNQDHLFLWVHVRKYLGLWKVLLWGIRYLNTLCVCECLCVCVSVQGFQERSIIFGWKTALLTKENVYFLLHVFSYFIKQNFINKSSQMLHCPSFHF